MTKKRVEENRKCGHTVVLAEDDGVGSELNRSSPECVMAGLSKVSGAHTRPFDRAGLGASENTDLQTFT